MKVFSLRISQRHFDIISTLAQHQNRSINAQILHLLAPHLTSPQHQADIKVMSTREDILGGLEFPNEE